MRCLIMLTILVAASAGLAFDLGSQAPGKSIHQVTAPPADPAVQRQGGDTIADAVPLLIPDAISGTTAGYADDYDEICPYDGSTSPDVVYTVTATMDVAVDIDLFGSAYDTKVYVYDIDMNRVGCNDDFYSDYTSKIENLLLVAGMQYFIVIDGYGGEFGDYSLVIEGFEPCILECPAGAELEGEPPLVDGYIDEHNQGCAGSGLADMQPINSSRFCGVSGFYSIGSSSSRDTDWFLLTMGPEGYLDITGDAELATFMFELGPPDCASVAVIQNVVMGPCLEGFMTILGEPGSTVWFWVGPTTYGDGEVFEYDYILTINDGVTAVERHSLTDIKGLFK